MQHVTGLLFITVNLNVTVLFLGYILLYSTSLNFLKEIVNDKYDKLPFILCKLNVTQNK